MRFTQDAFEYINTLKPELKNIIEDKLKQKGLFIVDREIIENEIKIIEMQKKLESEMQAKISINRATKKISAKEYEGNVKIDWERDITGQSRTRNTVNDFLRYFKSRFQRLSALLNNKRPGYLDIPIKKCEDLKDKASKVTFIGMVTEKKESKNGNIILTVEDTESYATLIITKDNHDIYEDAKTIVNDEVLRFYCRNNNLLLVEDFERPSYTNINWPVPEKDIAIAYISDIHAGSKIMLSDVFAKFISYIKNAEDELAGKIKYIVIAGDLVDGIGIYPNQEQELEIKDIFKQYEYFSTFINQLPDYIEVIISPGNHDAVRRAEPSHALDNKLLDINLKHYLVGNPSYVYIENIYHLIYHGTALDSIIANIRGLDYINVAKAMIEQLKRRHLSPIYGINPIVAEEFDYLVIDRIPHVYHAGHLHRTDYKMFYSTHVINSGTFQDRTAYQLKQGHLPTPGKLPILELKNNNIHIWDAYGN